MRFSKLAGAILVALALNAVASATALAAETLPTALPGAEHSKFTGHRGKLSIQIKGSGTFTCSESNTEGEIQTEKPLLLQTVNWGPNCTVGGLPVTSLGDASGNILSHVELHMCVISSTHLGWLHKLLPLHLEVLSTKLLLTVEGAFIAEVTPNKTKGKAFNLSIAQKEGKQAIEKCEGGSAQTLLTSLDGGAFIQSGQEAKEGTISFATEQEFMA